jgi:hypothetical protein
MADFSKATGFVLVALCLVRGGQLAWCWKHRAGNIVPETSCRKHRAVGIGFHARELLRETEDRWNLRANRVLHAERARKRVKIQREGAARPARRSADASRAAGKPHW